MAQRIPQSAASSRVQQFMQPTRAAMQFMQPARTPRFRQATAAAKADEQVEAGDDLVMNRRAALASGLVAAASMVPQTPSWAVNRKRGIDNPEEELEKLMEAKKAAAEKKKEKAEKDLANPKKEGEPDERTFPIAGAAAGGVALSIPLYFANLQRLGTKVASGGKDDGYRDSRRTVTGKNKRR
jgi:hypothetical protein